VTPLDETRILPKNSELEISFCIISRARGDLDIPRLLKKRILVKADALDNWLDKLKLLSEYSYLGEQSSELVLFEFLAAIQGFSVLFIGVKISVLNYKI
tara:strand:+ start:27 stop:323 length:297 start_codon:yes stop_codon:yes gene_type:complete